LIVVPAGWVSFSPGITLVKAFSHVWVPAGIEVFVGWALPTKKTVFRIWSDLAGTTIDAVDTDMKRDPREQGKAYYDRHYRTHRFFSSRRIILEDAMAKVLAYAESNRARTLLEIGCGTGLFGELVKKRSSLNYRGIDFSEEAVKQARERNPRNENNFHVFDAYEPSVYLHVDIVACFEVLEHLDDLSIIRNIPQGVFFIASVPSFEDPSHLRVYSPETIKERYGAMVDLDPEIRFYNKRMNGKSGWYLFSGLIRESKGCDSRPGTDRTCRHKAPFTMPEAG